MEIKLTQLKEFFSKLVTFNNCVQAEIYFFQYDHEEEGPKSSSSDTEHAVAFKKELVRTLEILNLHKEKCGRQRKQIMETITGKQEIRLVND